MTSQSFDQVLFFVFFVYGLAFFGMGLALALEAQRLPSFVEKKVLKPLAAFGLLHGVHEWLDSYLLQAQAAGTLQPKWLFWLRLILLIISFLFLLAYSIRTFQLPSYKPTRVHFFIMSVIGVYCVGILSSAVMTYAHRETEWGALLDALARYLLAVPGGILASFALGFQVYLALIKKDHQLAVPLTWAAVAFGIYGLSQVVVPPAEMFPANILNTVNFRNWFDFPVQIIRAVMATIVAVNLIRAIQVAERERQRQFVAIQQDRLDALQKVHEELLARENLRRELLRNTIRTQEDERARIARELHDETAQILSAASLNLATLHQLLRGNGKALEIVERLQNLTKQMSQGLYQLVHDLRPAQLDDLGLVSALNYLRENSAQKGLLVNLDVQGESHRLDREIETAIFRVAQEALTNILRHAKTREAKIELEYTQEQVRLCVSDRGVGFDPQEVFIPPRGWGLAGMRERIEALDGSLSIQSVIGAGTTIEAIIPYKGLRDNANGNNPLDAGG